MGGKLDLLQGTLDLMVLQTLAAMGPQHGYGVARRVELDGLVKAEWGTSENNRRARFYSLTKAGRQQLDERTEHWERLSAVMTRVLKQAE